MKVKIVKQTNTANYGYLEYGKIAEIDDKTAERWIKRGIAIKAEGIQPTDELKHEVPKQVEAVEKVAETAENNLDSLSFHDLRRLAKEQEIEGYGKMNTAELKEALLDAEGEETLDPMF